MEPYNLSTAVSSDAVLESSPSAEMSHPIFAASSCSNFMSCEGICICTVIVILLKIKVIRQKYQKKQKYQKRKGNMSRMPCQLTSSEPKPARRAMAQLMSFAAAKLFLSSARRGREEWPSWEMQLARRTGRGTMPLA